MIERLDRRRAEGAIRGQHEPPSLGVVADLERGWRRGLRKSCREMAEQPARHGAGPRRRHRTRRGRDRRGACRDRRTPALGREARREPSPVGPCAAIGYRYRRLVEQTSSWIESGPWSTRRSKEAIRLRRCPLADHATAQLTEWEKTLLRKAKKLRKLDVEKRHKLRILNKRLTYSIESLQDLFADESLTKQKSILKQLRRAQKSLGQLNDDARGSNAGRVVERCRSRGRHSLSRPQARKKLLRTASTAYRKLDKAKPFRSSDLVPDSEPED